MKKIIILAIAATLICASVFALSSCSLFNKDGGDHTHTMGAWTTVKNATCTEKGSETSVCTGEGCNHTETRDIPALGHDERVHAARPVGCTSSGWNEYVTCSRCDYNTKETLEPIGHSYQNGVCANCSQEHLHEFSDWYGDSATCAEAGTKHRDCDGCKYTETVKSETSAHTYGEDGSCTECGYTEGGVEFPPQEF